MKMFLISDNSDTLTGMRLSGVEGILVHNEEEFVKAIQLSREDKDIGMLMVNERLGERFPQIVNQLRQGNNLPLFVEIPDRQGSKRGSDFISRYIKEAIGVKL